MSDIVKKDGTSLDDFLASDDREENPTDSAPEINENGDNPSQEGEQQKADNTPDENNVPFHKHPRFQEIIKENQDLKQKVDDFSKFKEETEEKLTDRSNETPSEMPKWWVTLAGDDEISQEAYKQYLEETNQSQSQIKQDMVAEAEKAQKEQEAETKRYNDWVQNEVKSLEDSGKKFDKNKLLKIAVDYQPTDEEGNISLEKAYQIYEMQENQKDAETQQKKELADETQSTPNTEPKVQEFGTTANLRHRSWTSLVDNDN